jgi:hypothetical protein
MPEARVPRRQLSGCLVNSDSSGPMQGVPDPGCADFREDPSSRQPVNRGNDSF